jgi:hypothetical protein
MPGIQGDAPMQQLALPSSIDDLQRAITALEGTIYNLHVQLQPVLDSPTTLNGVDGEAKASAPPQYSTQINVVVSRIRELTSFGNDLISRLHV